MTDSNFVHTVPVHVYDVGAKHHLNVSSSEFSQDPSPTITPPSPHPPAEQDRDSGAGRSVPVPGGIVDPIKMVSLNVNGLKVPNKRRAIFGKLRDLEMDLCLLQETHSSVNDELVWKSEWGGPCYIQPW